MPGPVSSVAATFPGSSSTILSLSLSKPHPELVEGRTAPPLPRPFPSARVNAALHAAAASAKRLTW